MGYTILSVAYPLTQVGPDAPGGSEQILTLIDRELTKAGHRSLVLAVEGSKVCGTLLPSPAFQGRIDHATRRWAECSHRRLIMEALSQYQVDLVHMHALDFHRYIPPGQTPVLATLHLPVDWYPREIFLSGRKNFLLNCVSSSQQRCCPPTSKMLPHIPNGVSLSDYAPGKKGGYFLAMGRICPEKGFHHALDAARQVDVPLILAGPVLECDEHLEYFNSQIVPRLDDQRKYVGPVGLQQKRVLLSEAKALIVPSEVAETSSLVAMEAMASGTPVIAFPVGALPEVIEHGRTGLIVSSLGEMKDALRNSAYLDPANCRAAALARFDGLQTARAYLARYDDLVSRSRNGSLPRPGTSWLLPQVVGARRVANTG